MHIFYVIYVYKLISFFMLAQCHSSFVYVDDILKKFLKRCHLLNYFYKIAIFSKLWIIFTKSLNFWVSCGYC